MDDLMMSDVFKFMEEFDGTLGKMEFDWGCHFWDFTAEFVVCDTHDLVAMMRVHGMMFVSNRVDNLWVEYIICEDDGTETVAHKKDFGDRLGDIEISDEWTFDDYEW